MKTSLKKILAILLVAAVIGGPVFAQTASTTSTAPPMTKAERKNLCASERQNVIANCKNGDPCSAICKQAHQQMRTCREANNLPVAHPHTGKGSPCHKTGSASQQSNAPAVTQPAAPPVPGN